MNKSSDIFVLKSEHAISQDSAILTSDLPSRGQVIVEQNTTEKNCPSSQDDQRDLYRCCGESKGSCGSDFGLKEHMSQLANLIANVTEAYTVAIFIADTSRRMLTISAFHTLSRDFIEHAKIGFGSGLIGWTAENAVRISVCPFEHNATTLLCYSKDQDLKSFIAVPILSGKKDVLGVISCDSKKNYAFAKVTEKILLDCAQQAATVIELHQRLKHTKKQQAEPKEDALNTTIDRIRKFNDEQTLLNFVANIPSQIIKRDALVVMTTSEEGVGKGCFYTSSTESKIEHRLLELVCDHHKIICSERSVHALPSNDIKQRSFLSVPLHILHKEAGSINLLSRPYEAFDSAEINAVEALAKAVSRELERMRLRARFIRNSELLDLLSWRHFSIKAKILIAEALAKKVSLGFLRLAFTNLSEVEELAGIEEASSAMPRVIRLVEQIVRPPAIATHIYGNQVLILGDAAECGRLALRLRRLIERIGLNEFSPEAKIGKVGAILSKGLEIIELRCPYDGSTIEDLASASRIEQYTLGEKQQYKGVANAGNW